SARHCSAGIRTIHLANHGNGAFLTRIRRYRADWKGRWKGKGGTASGETSRCGNSIENLNLGLRRSSTVIGVAIDSTAPINAPKIVRSMFWTKERFQADRGSSTSLL